jgi:TRAP transporter 4TM/12TM fusion protein
MTTPASGAPIPAGGAPAPPTGAVVLEDDVVPTMRQVIRGGTLLQRIVAAAIVFLSMFLAVMMLYGAVAGSITSYLQRLVFVWAIVSIGLLVRSAGGTRWDRRSIASLVPDVIVIAVLTAGMVYVLSDYDEFSRRNGYPLPEDLAYGIVFLLATLEVTRRHLGWAMLLICAVFGLQALFGKHFPGMFAAPNVRWQTFVEVLFMQDQGMFGPTTAVAASYLMIFLIFGAMLVRTNGVDFFEKLSLALLGRRAGGPAHVSILSSALQGTTSGSVVGNVVGIGNVTIPLMMRSGFSPPTAGAIEAVSSSGAQIMPPVMGSAAFLMAGLLGVGYWTIVVAALIPAIYYFLALHLQVELYIRKRGIQATGERLPTIAEAMRSGGHLLLALAALIVPMVIGASPQLSAFIGLVSLFVVSLLHRSTRIAMVGYLESAVDAIANNVAVGAAVTTAGILMGTLWVSGAGNLLADFVVYAANGQLAVALVLTAIISLVLGMGLPTPAVYLTVAVLIVPALVRMGANELASHMFAFYFGILANVTPPVALAAYAAASIAGADLNRTGMIAMRLAISGFVIPFAFVYSPALLLKGSPIEIVHASLSCGGAMIALAIAVEGWCGDRLGWPTRVLLGLATACLVWRDPMVQAAGLAILVAVLAQAWLRARARAPASPIRRGA